jgi:hypothetical protein
MEVTYLWPPWLSGRCHPRSGTVSEETMWANMRTLLTAVIPVAEQAGVRLALHPEDPPVGPGRSGAVKRPSRFP